MIAVELYRPDELSYFAVTTNHHAKKESDEDVVIREEKEAFEMIEAADGY